MDFLQFFWRYLFSGITHKFFQFCTSFSPGSIGSGSSHTPTGTSHSLNQASIQLTAFGHCQYLPTLLQPFCVFNTGGYLRIIGFQTACNGCRHSPCHRITSSGCGSCLMELRLRKLFQFNFLSCQHAFQFLEGNNKIHIAAYFCSGSFQFF